MVIVATALFAIGVFDVGNVMGNRSDGFSGVAVKGWKMDTSGTFMIKLSNQVDQPINITGINIAIGQATLPIDGTPVVLEAGTDTSTLSTNKAAFGAQVAGTEYVAKVHVNYTDLDSGFASATSGTLTGRAA